MYTMLAFGALVAWFTAVYVCIANFSPLDEAFDGLE